MDIVTSVTTSKNIQYEIADKKSREEKLNKTDLPHQLSYFENDSHFIDKTVTDLLNYYKKSETYSKSEIQELLNARLTIAIVQELPTENISPSTIYFVPRPNGEQEYDVYDEYIYTGTWELIGNTYVDLSDYYKKSETNTQIQNAVSVESQARTLADNTLQTSIGGIETDIQDISTSLNSEISARQSADNTLTSSIQTVGDDLSSEITRATNAESALSDRIDVIESHLSDETNPHNVTAEQVGLGNVTNVGTTNTITPNSEENITSGAVYTGLDTKVDKVQGKGLSDQNFTYAEKVKLSGLSNYDDSTLSDRVTATESAITTLNGDSTVTGSVDKKIADALGNITTISFEIVASLPASGESGVIYFVYVGSESGNSYDEYVWLNNDWELLAKSAITIDLSDYYTKAQANALISVKQDKITIENDTSALTDSDSFDETSAGTNQTTTKRRLLSSLWTYLENKISSILGLTSTQYDGNSATTTSADITKTTNSTDGDQLQIGNGQSISITNSAHSHVSDNASTADTLTTARTINGTSFDGSANITTAKWGTARNIYITDSTGSNVGSAVSVNGSSYVTLRLPSTINAIVTLAKKIRTGAPNSPEDGEIWIG